MRKPLVAPLLVLVIFVGFGPALADTLSLDGPYSYPIDLDLNGSFYGLFGGGSIAGSTLNGTALSYVYCVGLTTTVYVPGTYSQTHVDITTGQVYGNDFGDSTTLRQVPNAGQVAWLLGHYAAEAATSDQQVALQAAIWHVITTGGGYSSLNTPSVRGIISLDQSSSAYDAYNTYLAALGTNTESTTQFYWMTPGNGSQWYQALVAPVPMSGEDDGSPATPIPGAFLLFAPGLAGLIGLKRKYVGCPVHLLGTHSHSADSRET